MPPAVARRLHRPGGMGEPIALGVWVPGLPGAAALDAHAALVGRMPAIAHWFQHWERSTRAFDADAATTVVERGAVPMISWEPWAGLDVINRGERDAHVREYARAVAVWGGPLYLRFAHEMNGDWIRWGGDPPAYRSAWRRLREIFATQGADAVRWVWSPYVPDRRAAPFDAYYPGDDLVDWVALDGYNWGRSGLFSRWRSFDAVFDGAYRALAQLAPDRPMMLAEIGCAQAGGDKAAWIRDAFLEAVPDRYPRVRAVVWFNEDKAGHADWRVESSPASLAAWREVAADPRYAARLTA